MNKVGQSSFQEEVIQSPVPVVVDFSATWCAPCRMIAPILDELATEYAGRVKFLKVDVDEEQQLAAQYRISSVPTLLLFKNGEVRNVVVGLKSKADLKRLVDELLT